MEDCTHLARRSLSDRIWIEPPSPAPEGVARRLSRELDLTSAFGRILAARGMVDPGEAYRFLHPDGTQVHPPFLMLGMDTAVDRLVQALENFEKVVIFGDYDVDGTASASILYSYLKRLGARVNYYIPHRISDGYGFTPATLAKLFAWRADLVVTCDHGSTDVEAPHLLKKQGVDLIVTDHHRLGSTVPAAAAFVNPQQPGCPYPFKDLSAAGVAYKVTCALEQRLADLNFWDRHGLCQTSPDYFLDLVALATVADMSPLVGENRILVKLGLELLNSRLKPGLSGLVKECRVRGPITPSTISFKLAPKINATGRVGDPRLGMQLLLAHSFTEARRLARCMMEMNRERQEIEREVYANAQELMDALPELPATVLVGVDWHPGVIGSIATRIAFQTRRPTVVLTQNQTPELMGSARSSENFNVLQVLENCRTLLERFGGHPSAAGLSLQNSNLEAFTDHFQATVERDGIANPGRNPNQLRLDAWLELDALTPRFFSEVSLLSPFGNGNPEPVVGLRGFTVTNPSVFNHRHLKFSLACQDGSCLEAFAWDHSDWEVRGADRYDIAFMPQVFEDGHAQRRQLRVLDLKVTE